MKTKLHLSLLTLTSLVVSTQTAIAQTYQPSDRTPVADNTLGTQVSGNGSNFNITGGLTKGQTLFHSFTDFSVPTNGQANFTNPVGNRDIITRVTGGVFSDINGLVNTNGANFFLINPSGITFGTNARLNVGKAFVGSTANGIDLVDGSGRMITFGANPSGDAPLLSIAPNVLFDVSRLNMGGGTGAISNYGTLQTQNNSQYIGLIGGNVSLNGGQINAPGGRVELGGLSAPGTITFGIDVNNLSAQFPTNVAREDVSLTNGARVDVAGSGGGDIAISARNLEILGGSVVRGGIATGLGTSEAVAGDIKLNATGDIVVASNSLIFNDVRLNSKGQGGNLTIDTGSLSLQDGAQLSTSTAGTGNAGNVTVTAKNAVSLVGQSNAVGQPTAVFSIVEAGGVGKGGTIDINTGSLSLRDGAALTASTAGTGNAGNVKLTAKNAVSLVNGDIFNRVEAGGVGTGGTIEIDATSLSIQDSAQVATSTIGKSDTQPIAGQGDAGNIKITVTGAVDIAGSKGPNPSGILSTIGTGVVGKGSNITIDAGSFALRDGAKLSASTFGQGDAGSVKLTAKNAVSLVNGNIFSRVEAGGVGTGGTIEIDAASLSIKDSAQVATSTIGKSDTEPTAGQGAAGDITVTVTGAVDIAGKGTVPSGIRSTIGTGAIGTGGNISIEAGSFSLRDGARLSTSTAGTGNAGSVKLTAKNAVSLVNGDIFSRVEAGGVGTTGGTIEIDAASLSIQDSAQVATSTIGKSDTEPTAGQGDAGNIKVTVTGAVDIAGIKGNDRSGILSTIGTGAIGKGGNITIDAGSFSLRDGARLEASTYGQGDAGNVNLTAKNAVSLTDRANIFSSVNPGGVGKGGNIEIEASSLSLRNGSQIINGTYGKTDTQPPGEGTAGNIKVKVTGAVDLAGIEGIESSAMFSDVEAGTKGDGGNITIDAGSLSLKDGAKLVASTEGEGRAGTIKVNATDFVTISGKNDNDNYNNNVASGLLVDSQSKTGTAGDIIVTSPKITLDNGGKIKAESISGNGGNINIGGKLKNESAFSPGNKIDLSNLTPTDLLILRRGGNISTNAGGTAQQGGDGGNININSSLIVAIPKENSDITANAVKGRGGSVKIESQGLFGIQFRPRLTDNSDITASSDFDRQGNVNIDTPGTDPGRDSTELPNTTTDASNQISQVCSADNRQNKLTVIGRGGLPPNANDPLTSDVVWQDARAASSQPTVSSATTNPGKLPPPAVGWVFDGKGKVTLIAAGTQGQPTGTRVACPK